VYSKKDSSAILENLMATTKRSSEDSCRNRPSISNKSPRSSKSLDEGINAVAMATMISNNQSFNNLSIADDVSHSSHRVSRDGLNEIDVYDFDGDSITDFEGNGLDVESQHRNGKKRLPPPSLEGPKTHHVEFDPLALGRGSENNNSSKISDVEQSSSGKNSVLSFSDKTSLGSSSKKKKAKKKSNSKVKNMVNEETRRIRRWKLASVFSVVVVGLVASVYLFFVVFDHFQTENLEKSPERQEKDNPLYYKAVFEFEETANKYFRQSVQVLEEISAALTEHANGGSIDSDNNWQTAQASAQTNSDFPFVTLPNFPEMAREMPEIILADGAQDRDHRRLFQRVFWAPVVDNTTEADWQDYSFNHQGWIMDTDLKWQDKMDNHDVEEFDDIFNPQTMTDLWLVDDEDNDFPTPDDMPEKISPYIHTNLLEMRNEDSENGSSKMIRTEGLQYSSDDDAKRALDHLPAWQTFDFDHYESNRSRPADSEEPKLACDVEFVNFDLYSWFTQGAMPISTDDDGSVLRESLGSGVVHLWNDQPFKDVQDHDNEDGEHGKSPTSIFLRVPVYDRVETRNIAGYVFAVLDEEIGFFRESAMKSNSSFPLRLVVKEESIGRKKTQAKKRTYEIRGSNITKIADDDDHHEIYNDEVFKFRLRTESEGSTSSTLFSMYPTPEFFINAATLTKEKPNNPSMLTLSDQYPVVPAVWSASLVLSVFAVILIIFICYDNSVEDRQRKLLRQAERTDAIVGSMFPANIQGRLMMIDDDTIESSQKQKGAKRQKEENFPHILAGFDASAHNALVSSEKDTKTTTSINNGSMHTQNDSINNRPTAMRTRKGRKHGNGRFPPPAPSPTPSGELKLASSSIDESLLRFGNTKPMADFYPNTTILMCDIAGFTAWSSARAPADVFRLLETIYGAFDDIARAEKVFKVETVGDCYVACAGLPIKQPKHAVIMAKFAKKSLKRYETLIKKLETYLGPDTVDLGLRMGIHSGPVTAGVLRGDKTRFQLFGDTVNTASRMESTGKVNMIQVSPQTANLLKDEGLGKWVVPRENLVTVKGKGEMQTYWLLRSASSMSSTLSQPSLASTLCGSPKIGKGSSIWKMNAPQQRRNSMGASNASWETSSTGTQSSGSVQSHPQRRHSNSDNAARNSKERRLIEWMVETFMKSLKKIAAHRIRNVSYQQEEFLDGKELSFPALDPEAQIIEEIKEVIPIRRKDNSARRKESLANSLSSTEIFDNPHIAIPRVVERQLRDFITVVSLLYHDHPFHNFEHCAHVLMSVLKLLSRIMESRLSASDSGFENLGDDHAYGITSDPLLEFSCLFSALIHDVDHSGVPNSQLVKENTTAAIRYHNRSVAEQHSIAVAWSLLMQPCYRELRECIYRTQTEFDRFRQLVVNSVMATDIMDRDLKKFRDNRWEKAFDLKNDFEAMAQNAENANRMATVVIEHMIQASDISHTMQHWHVYLKFNERLFRENYQAFKEGRAEKDPSEYWYEGELNFFKFYIIPLALKLKECGVFGVSGDECFFHAESNRSEWALKGREVVEKYVGRASRDISRNSSRSNSPNPLLTNQLLKLPEGNEPSPRRGKKPLG